MNMTAHELSTDCTDAAKTVTGEIRLILKEAARMLRDQADELEKANTIIANVAAAISKQPAPPKKKGNPLGCGLKVYLVEDTQNAPGRVLAVMADEGEANWFADQLPENAEVRPRKLWYGQPSNCGYND